MINGISIVSVWVLDQDSAKEFYADKLGFTVTNDIQLEGGMRWLTVRPPGNDRQELLLMDLLGRLLVEHGVQRVHEQQLLTVVAGRAYGRAARLPARPHRRGDDK